MVRNLREKQAFLFCSYNGGMCLERVMSILDFAQSNEDGKPLQDICDCNYNYRLSGADYQLQEDLQHVFLIADAIESTSEHRRVETKSPETTQRPLSVIVAAGTNGHMAPCTRRKATVRGRGASIRGRSTLSVRGFRPLPRAHTNESSPSVTPHLVEAADDSAMVEDSGEEVGREGAHEAEPGECSDELDHLLLGGKQRKIPPDKRRIAPRTQERPVDVTGHTRASRGGHGNVVARAIEGAGGHSQSSALRNVAAREVYDDGVGRRMGEWPEGTGKSADVRTGLLKGGQRGMAGGQGSQRRGAIADRWHLPITPLQSSGGPTRNNNRRANQAVTARPMVEDEAAESTLQSLESMLGISDESVLEEGGRDALPVSVESLFG